MPINRAFSYFFAKQGKNKHKKVFLLEIYIVYLHHNSIIYQLKR